MREDTSQGDPAVVWHLSRGPEHLTVISDQALRALAALGKLKANDLLWRPGFESWKSAQSVPGLLALPPLPIERPDQTLGETGWVVSHVDLEKISTSMHSALIGWRKRILLLGRDRLRSYRFFARGYGRKANRVFTRTAIKFETLLSRTEHPRILAGILASWVLVGTIDIVLHESEADAQLAPKNVEYVQPRSPTTPATVSHNSNYSKSPIDPDVAGDFALSIVSFQMTESVNRISDLVSNATSHSDPATPSGLIEASSQEGASDPIPLPTKKPARLAKPLGVVSKSQGVSQAVRHGKQPQPLRFGTIGFAYSNQ
jgi:hypothetical protein